MTQEGFSSGVQSALKSTAGVAVVSGIFLAGIAALGVVLYKKQSATLSDGVPKYKAVPNKFFVFENTMDEFTSLGEFITELRFGWDNPKALKLTKRDFRVKKDGVYYSGERVLRHIIK